MQLHKEVTVKNLFKNEIDYIGVELTTKEASIVSKVLGNIPLDQRNEFLSPEEQGLCTKLYIELKA